VDAKLFADANQLLTLLWRQESTNPQHCLQSALAFRNLQGANSFGLSHHRGFVGRLLGEQRSHLGMRLVQFPLQDFLALT
jgi:hypothetical protein